MTEILGIRSLVYVAFADDAQGTGFTTIDNPSKDYAAILISPIVIESPSAVNFQGLWFKRKGEQGDQGIQGPVGPMGPSGPAWTINPDQRPGQPTITFGEYQTQGIDEVNANLNLQVGGGVNGRELIWMFQKSNNATITLANNFIAEPGSVLPANLVDNVVYIMKMRYVNFKQPYGETVIYTIFAV